MPIATRQESDWFVVTLHTNAMRSSEPEIEVLPPEDEDRPSVDPLLEQVSRLMDSYFEIPGLRIRFGLDPLLGLIPGLGDTITTFISLLILSSAVQYHVPRITLARMGLNVAIDLVVGAVPVIGDLFDVAWKANDRNIELLRRSLMAAEAGRRRASVGDWLFVGGMVLALLALFAVCLVAAWSIAAFLVRQMAELMQA